MKGQVEMIRWRHRDRTARRGRGGLAGRRTGRRAERSLAVEEQRANARAHGTLDGQVLEMDLAQRQGQPLAAGELCTVAALHAMAVEFRVGETQVGRVKVGQPVAVKVMSFPS
jgi:multidrug resistance efflux pump